VVTIGAAIYAQSSSQIVIADKSTQKLFTGRTPFLSPNQQRRSTERKLRPRNWSNCDADRQITSVSSEHEAMTQSSNGFHWMSVSAAECPQTLGVLLSTRPVYSTSINTYAYIEIGVEHLTDPYRAIHTYIYVLNYM